MATVEGGGAAFGSPPVLGGLTGAVLAAVCHVLYGERLGLLQDFVDPEAQRFIDAVTLMFHTTSPMLYLPPALLRGLNARTWRDHVHAWDAIFTQGELSSSPVAPEATGTGQGHPQVPPLVVAPAPPGTMPLFAPADKCIQNVYRDLRLQRKGSREYGGILSSLLLQDKLPLDDIKASVTEMMAGGVDTVRGRARGGGDGAAAALSPAVPRCRPR